ncbi:MAG: transcriptional regulator, LysR family [Devosia sp.]|jgi:DNA-binding transcriptional LysR family regulator|nr:transcriptional regulator, LysR family [Devosia sp.]
MDRLDAMRVFVRVVERSSFVRAAEDLGLPASTTSEAVKQLERRLGVKLLERSTRQVRTTSDGQSYYNRCVALLTDIEDAESAFDGRVPRGQLTVGVMGVQARQIIVPALPSFFAKYPELRLHLNEDDRYVDLVREGVDCVIRSGNPGQGDLAGNQLANVSQVTVASSAYIKQFGTPAGLAQLQGHKMVGFHSTATGSVLPLEFDGDGEMKKIALPTQLTVSGAETLLEAARKGLGIVQLPYYAVASDIASGSMVEILSDTPPPSMSVHVLYPNTKQPSLRVRVFLQWIADLYRAIGQES